VKGNRLTPGFNQGDRNNSIDPVRLEIFRSLFTAVAEEMGATLMRSASSPNIKERRDYSCAVFTGDGKLVAQGEHMPVHLGSMPLSVQTVLGELDLTAGDVVILNDPYRGGTHLPDITMIAPVYVSGAEDPAFYVANRAHHADVGGMSAGSMPLATEIYQEGIIIPPVKWQTGGQQNNELQEMLLRNVRTPEERREDLAAQTASLRVGEERLREIADRYSLKEIQRFMHQVLEYSQQLMRSEIREIPDGDYSADDQLDNDGITDEPINIHCTIQVRDKQVTVDFSHSDTQVPGSMNAVYAITYSATVYCFRSIARDEIPVNDGCFRPIAVIAPAGSVVNAASPAAVAGGNVETSQRIVDVVFKALSQAIPDRIPAASQGTMNNLAIGGTKPEGRPFSYYETIAGGMGARPSKPGIPGIHTHMTNTMNTPVEALESTYPVRVEKYMFRKDSGGDGAYRGGDGLIRQIRMLSRVTVTLLSDRRSARPYGLEGGGSGRSGVNRRLRENGWSELPSKFNLEFMEGESLKIETPGGGGYGKK